MPPIKTGPVVCAQVGSSITHVLSLQHKRIAAIAETPGEAALHADHGVDGHLGRAAFVVGPFPFGRLPGDTQLGQCLARGPEEAP